MPGRGAGVCAEHVEFSGWRLLVPPEQDALTPKNTWDRTEFTGAPHPGPCHKHAFSHSSPPCAGAATGSYVSPN